MNRLRQLMQLWSILFSGMAMVLLLIPAQVVALLNHVGTTIGWSGADLALPSTRFFSALGVSLLVVLIALAHLANQDLPARLPLIRIFILSKFVSSAVYLLALWQDQYAFAYFAAAVIDGGIGLITWLVLRSATCEQ